MEAIQLLREVMLGESKEELPSNSLQQKIAQRVRPNAKPSHRVVNEAPQRVEINVKIAAPQRMETETNSKKKEGRLIYVSDEEEDSGSMSTPRRS